MVVEGDAGALGAEAVDPALQNASSLEMTRANQTTQKGDRQVVEVIDTGIEATHQAFSGSMDGVDVRLSQSDVEALVGKLPHGKTGAYLNNKIPFVFDYADNDADVLPKSSKDLSPTPPTCRAPRPTRRSSSRRSPPTRTARSPTTRSWRPSTTRSSSSPTRSTCLSARTRAWEPRPEPCTRRSTRTSLPPA